MNEKQPTFEQGPIRPPSEARSLLLRLTRNCPWNQCLFCPVYKKRKFSLRTVNEIKQDIQCARDIADEIKEISFRLGSRGEVDGRIITHLFGKSEYSENYRGIGVWLHYKTGACFLQDADNMIMKTEDLIEVLRFLRERFPEIQRVTTYARSRSIARKSLASMQRIHDAGLDRIHIGLESGCDQVLKSMKKGVTAAQHIDAGIKVTEAGIELSEYVMPGLGGREFWKKHMLDTAHVLNQINPHFIRLRTLRVPEHIPLYKKLKQGKFTIQPEEMILEEIHLLIEHLQGITSRIESDHIMNLLEEVTGDLPEDKEKMLDVIDGYNKLPKTERIVYRLGRLGGAYRSVKDLEKDPDTYSKIKNLLKDIQSKHGLLGVEKFLTEMVDRYI